MAKMHIGTAAAATPLGSAAATIHLRGLAIATITLGAYNRKAASGSNRRLQKKDDANSQPGMLEHGRANGTSFKYSVPRAWGPSRGRWQVPRLLRRYVSSRDVVDAHRLLNSG